MPDDYAILPYGNPWNRISKDRLEGHADEVFRSSSLLSRVAAGDKDAITAYFIGFWPFVDPFSSHIYAFPKPHRLLVEHLGSERARQVLRGAGEQFVAMGAEELEHAGLWEEDARMFGIPDLSAASQQHRMAPSLQQLINRSASVDSIVRLTLFGATEGVAEALSRHLANAPEFITLLGGRYRWGDAHLMSHPGPSHYEIDLGLLEACWSKGPPDEMMSRSIEASIMDDINLFGRAADEVEQIYCPLG